MSSILAQKLSSAAASGKLAFLPFIPAGYPDLATTASLLTGLSASGADVIEVGFPFSDPIADGPVIQQAFLHALNHGTKTSDVFKTVASVRSQCSAALVAMVSYSVVFRYGLDRFLTDAKSSGFDALLLPDLPPPEAQSVCQRITAAGLDTVLLVAPSTPDTRRKEIARLATGFIYYLSVAGITGERTSLPADLSANLANLKTHTHKPICVGFGISQPDHLKQLKGHASGAIVGSALVKILTAHLPQGQTAAVEAVLKAARELASAC